MESVYKLLKEMCEINSIYEQDFINWCSDNICKSDCSYIDCSNHYTKGLLIGHIIGCFVLKYNEKEAYTILNTIK